MFHYSQIDIVSLTEYKAKKAVNYSTKIEIDVLYLI